MYHGKFEAKYRNQRSSGSVREAAPAAPERVPARTAAPQPSYQKASGKKRPRTGSVIFYTIYFICIFAFLGGMFFLNNWLTGWLTDYEAAQPTTKCEEIFSALFDDPDWATLYEMAALEDTTFEGADAFVAYMEDRVGSSALTYQETSAGLSGDKKYYVKLGDEKIASFTLVGDKDFITDIPDWQLGTVELFYTRDHSIQVQKMDGHTVYVNGVALDESYTIQIGSTIAENYLPTGVHGPRIYTQQVTGLFAAPVITVQDEAGTQMEVSYDEAKDIYTVQTATNTISEEETTLALEASRVYARFMIEEAGSNQVAKYFDPTSDIYKTICRSETWMQSNQGYDFANETVSDYYRYTDDLFSVHVVMTLNVTRNNGSVKEYPMDSTLFFQKQGNGKWMAVNMTNVDISKQVASVRLTFVNGTDMISTGFFEDSITELFAPVITAPEGQVFSGWVREVIGEDGVKTLNLVFTPEEDGRVVIPEGYTLEPMTLYPLFEDAAASTEGE